ncbi:hypothetical protein HYV81_05150 [Candidatus Woesearchaeota archaeon]|nr:hypothetical protein [Candidatus Woesearchaeota archaeon]
MESWYAVAGLAFILAANPVQSAAQSLDIKTATRIEAERRIPAQNYYTIRIRSYLEVFLACDGKEGNANFDMDNDEPKDFVIQNGTCKERTYKNPSNLLGH